jgi:hypothetical protein
MFVITIVVYAAVMGFIVWFHGLYERLGVLQPMSLREQFGFGPNGSLTINSPLLIVAVMALLHIGKDAWVAWRARKTRTTSRRAG